MSPKEKELTAHETTMTASDDVEEQKQQSTPPPPLDNAPNDDTPEQTESTATATTNKAAKTGRTKSVLGRMSMFFSADMQYPGEQQQDDADDDEETQSCCRKLWDKWWKFYNTYEFLILVIIAICVARAYPPLGAEYLQPQITSTWVAVIFIFLLAGLGLKTEEFSKAFQRFKFNLFVQLFSFGVDSSIVFGVSRGLLKAGALSEPLANGIVVCSCLSMTINMVLVLTKNAGGDEASAIFNAAAGNMIGVFLSPVLILGYLGVTSSVDVGEIFYKLALRVVLPIIIGQLLRKFVPVTVEFYMKHKQTFKKAQQLALVFIVYTTFCSTFSNDNSEYVTGVDIVVMVAVEFVCLSGLMVLAWFSLPFFLRGLEPKLRVMGLFGCTHKTVAMGVPLINAIYENDPWVGLIILPLLVWHTMQLILGSILAPKLAKWVEREEERLGITNSDDEDDDNAPKEQDVEAAGEQSGSNNEVISADKSKSFATGSMDEMDDTTATTRISKIQSEEC